MGENSPFAAQLANKFKLSLKLNQSFFQSLVTAFARFLVCCVIFAAASAKANSQESLGKFNRQRLTPESIPTRNNSFKPI
ncbi:MAG TPA: hypothetical protein V6C71_03460 [Coleofasciculaceae cyanobacterium]|jgi:cell shape-determining protein MreD